MLSHAARLHVVASLISVFAVSACSTTSPVTASRKPSPKPVVVAPQPPGATVPARASKPQDAAQRAAVAAVEQVGVPYRYGGASKQGFDCSGLVYFAYSRAGIPVPRTTGDLWQQLSPIGVHDLQVGDVLFFDIAGKISHVGLYLGDERFVHAPSSGKEVTIASLSSSYYEQAFIRGGRPD